ncbi:MAG: DNA starvation/stationary phase protection protein [Hyphomicrobiales bacterium]|nr:DNA starvation/stationary phase protection protein [Rickettsiales bacterium]MCP5361942.1 DNA starvation/stationary phase protection protein [Hyphomicrobiales bacterium]
MSNKPVTEQLKNVLADTYTLYLKTQNYHWNVKGPQFSSLHTLFETQYTALAMANDEIAERIRALGELAPGTYEEFAKRSKVGSGKATLNAEGMLKDLIKSHELTLESLDKALAAAEKAEDAFTADLMTARIGAHEKDLWMLHSQLG